MKVHLGAATFVVALATGLPVPKAEAQTTQPIECKRLTFAVQRAINDQRKKESRSLVKSLETTPASGFPQKLMCQAAVQFEDGSESSIAFAANDDLGTSLTVILLDAKPASPPTEQRSSSSTNWLTRIAGEENSCQGIIPYVSQLSLRQLVSIVKIYSSREIRRSSSNFTCTGEALLSTGERQPIFFRKFKDKDGDVFFQYSPDDDMSDR